jgi:hypothetical protein
MRPRPSRLAIGDYLAVAGALALLIVLFAFPWYQVQPRTASTLLLMGERLSANGWQTFTWIGPLCVLVALLALGAGWFQLTRASPALAIVTTIVLTPLALLLVVALVVRVLISTPSVQLPAGGGGALQTCTAAYIGLAAAILITAGAWLSLRRDGIDPGDSPADVETVQLSSPPLGGPGIPGARH